MLKMVVARKLIFVLLAFALMTGCKHKKKPSMSGEEAVQVSDFIEFFQPVKLSYQLADSILPRKEKVSRTAGNLRQSTSYGGSREDLEPQERRRRKKWTGVS